ncbi:hypothetical protein Ade02nite_13570 [Paractinoplanes deccanensis]|uniref:LPXTG cell wall anchor domain-containing protein n=1 Tax=Paractinoplanes deccanensis TaxID=113561 RepID=A0ABQ3XY91_9ACTN|nr:hypothetical protein [Actinoplanes deccanensis]GID72716.1 hypothetical protein Ade02nite_13570 [Actinoplanes deccanensis]
MPRAAFGLAMAHQHAGPSPADALLLAVGAILAVVLLTLIFRRPRVRARADGRWRLPPADRHPPEGDQGE